VILPKGARFVIWGLKNTRHSHRYIHKGFFETIRRNDAPALWLNDEKNNQSILKEGDIVITAGVACRFLPIVAGAHYILHNVESSISNQVYNKIFLQVSTHDSKGEKMDNSIAMWNSSENTLYQPWGLPEPSSTWLNPAEERVHQENWIGAVWDNHLKQGNKEAIQLYKATLKQNGIKFKRFGGTRSISLEGLSSTTSLYKVNQSAIGAAIVGNWQKKNGYVPCRAFKNIASGAVPISNSNLTRIFGDAYLHSDSIDELVEIALNLNAAEIAERSKSCKEVLPLYSYEASLERILSVLL
jgi:hypothetical protein